MLGDYRVLDLTDDRGHLAAFMLAGLGADVILVEPPQGSPARRRGPVRRRRRSTPSDRSRSGAGTGASAASCWTSTTARAGPTSSGWPPMPTSCSTSGATPVDLAALRAANPALVTVSISAFGESGPKADWPATDLTVLAAGCQLAITGDSDRAPVRTAVPQAFLHACADAAAGALHRPDRARSQRPGSARRGVGAAVGAAGHAELRAGGAPRRHAGATDERRCAHRWSRHPAGVAVQGRLRVGHVPVRRLDRAVHAPAS